MYNTVKLQYWEILLHLKKNHPILTDFKIIFKNIENITILLKMLKLLKTVELLNNYVQILKLFFQDSLRNRNFKRNIININLKQNYFVTL